MTAPCSDAEFVEMFETIGPQEMSKKLGVQVRTIYRRRLRIEKLIERELVPPNGPRRSPRVVSKHPAIIELDVPDGVVLVGSDAHYWPHVVTPAHRAFVQFCTNLRPKVVIMNGDVMDGSSISRYPPIGWEHRPTVKDEVDTITERLGEISSAAKNAKLVWPLGNHDGRFEARLANVAPEYAGMYGAHLSDHFPEWWSCWEARINADVVVRHRFKGGIHATHNNTMWSGRTMITGHLHSLKVTPFADLNGNRFGVDTGTLATPYGPQFADYTELSPVNWRSGFVVLTFRDGRLMWPEIVHVVDENCVEFRGEIIEV